MNWRDESNGLRRTATCSKAADSMTRKSRARGVLRPNSAMEPSTPLRAVAAHRQGRWADQG